jgi:hypothetical protein
MKATTTAIGAPVFIESGEARNTRNTLRRSARASTCPVHDEMISAGRRANQR